MTEASVTLEELIGANVVGELRQVADRLMYLATETVDAEASPCASGYRRVLVRSARSRMASNERWDRRDRPA